MQILITHSLDWGSKLIFFTRAWGRRVHHLGSLSWVLSDGGAFHLGGGPPGAGPDPRVVQKPPCGSAPSLPTRIWEPLHQGPHFPDSLVPEWARRPALPPGIGLSSEWAGIPSLSSVDSALSCCPYFRAGMGLLMYPLLCASATGGRHHPEARFHLPGSLKPCIMGSSPWLWKET